MRDALRPPVGELRPDRSPKSAIFLRAEADLANRIIGTWHIYDVHHALSAGECGPDRPRRDVPPGRRIEIDALFARAECDPFVTPRLFVLRDECGPVEALGPHRHDDNRVDA